MPFYFLSLLILSLTACCIEVDISVPSFPKMRSELNVSDHLIQMTIAYNFLGFFLSSIFYGPLSDAYGRRPFMIWGNGILALSAIGCTLAPSISFLLVMRFIQGIGAAASAVLVFAIIADAYPTKDKSTKLIGIMNAFFSTLMAAAPIMGGVINQVVGWRGNYGIVAFICFASWICLILFLPETKQTHNIIYFKAVKKAYFKLLKNKSFISACLAPSLIYAPYLAFIAQAPFLYTETFNLSVTEYVFHQFIIVMAFSIVSLFSGYILQKVGAQKCIIKGMTISGISIIILIATCLLNLTSAYLITILMSFICLGGAMCYPPIFAASLEIYPDLKGTASSLIMSLRSLLCFSFVALTGYSYNGNPLQISFVMSSAFALCLFFTIKVLRAEMFVPPLSVQNVL